MNKAACFFLLLLAALSGFGQTISNDRLKELFRNQQLAGGYRSGYSLTVNPNQISLGELDSALGVKKHVAFTEKQINVQFLPATIIQQYNSQLPYEWNLGAMIPAKGYQVMASLGVFASIGKHITIQVAPEFVRAANPEFEGFSRQLNDRAWRDRYTFWNTIDIPERFGNSPYQKVFAGQSSIRYNTGLLSFGISTENLWWGPGYRNSLIMSTNAPGFLHATINTIKPLVTRIGSFEGQVIGGTLTSSGFLPPRIHTVYEFEPVYVPKQEKQRYLTGMVLSWNPKWTPGLYLGISKASYLYTDEITNPLDVLPLQGFFGSARTKAERNGTKASMGSLFARYVMPEEKAELYMEFGRKDASLMPWNLIRSEMYRRAYIFGLRKLFNLKNGAYIQLAGEFTQLQAPTAELIRQPDSWYSHPYVRQGYTNRGKPIGAGIGPGSNSQTIELAWVKGLKRIGVQFERVRYQSDYYYYAFEYLQDFRRHWVDVAVNLKADWNVQRFVLSAQLGMVRSNNYQWQVIQVDPTDLFAPGNEFFNLTPKINISYRF